MPHGGWTGHSSGGLLERSVYWRDRASSLPLPHKAEMWAARWLPCLGVLMLHFRLRL